LLWTDDWWPVKVWQSISEGLRQEAGDKLRVTIISPGFVQTKLADSMKNPKVNAQIVDTWPTWRSRQMRSLAPLRSRSSSRQMLM
jgi:hypothetical protein